MASMASMTYSTLPHPLLTASLRGKATAKTIADLVHIRPTAAVGYCTQRRLESARWSKSSTGKQRRFSRVRGMTDDEGTNSTEKSSAAATEVDSSMNTGTSTSNSVENKKAAVRAEVERGRNTAILTGAISVLLGVGYLVLLQLLDTRGIEHLLQKLSILSQVLHRGIAVPLHRKT